LSIADDLFEGKPPEIRTVQFPTDRDLAERYNAALARHETASVMARTYPDGDRERTELAEAEEERDRLAAEMRGKLITFTFRSVDPETFDRLKAEHRPTESQKTAARKTGRDIPEWDPDTFGPALVAAACVKVEGPSGVQDGLSTEDAQRLWASERWNAAERGELQNAALGAYLTRIRVDLPKAETG
jgi:hypothetical protein